MNRSRMLLPIATLLVGFALGSGSLSPAVARGDIVIVPLDEQLEPLAENTDGVELAEQPAIEEEQPKPKPKPKPKPRTPEDELATDKKPKENRPKKKDDPQVVAMMQESRPKFEALLNGRLYAVRDVCRPTREQQQALLDDGKLGMEKALRAYAKFQAKQNNGGMVFAGNQRPKHPNPIKEMDEAIAKAVTSHLDEAQQEKHREEEKKRKAFRRHAIAAVMVGAIDDSLVLTDEQREKVAMNLRDNWNPKWNGCEQMLTHGSQYLPKVPDKLVTPFLDEKQKRLWKSTRRNSYSFFSPLNVVGADDGCRLAPFEVEDLEPPTAVGAATELDGEEKE